MRESLQQIAAEIEANPTKANRESLVEALSDPALFTRERAIEIARQAAAAEPLLDVKLARRLAKLDADAAEHVLAILEAISDGSRIAVILGIVSRHPNPRLRSKAALLAGRYNKLPQWLESQLQAPDARVRANAVEALWGVEARGIGAALRHALQDPSPRVVANALVAFHRLGDASILPEMFTMARSPKPADRAAAAWAMGESGDRLFLPILKELSADPVQKVARMASRAIKRMP